ncbi:MAG: response regulator [Planctomycetia bacterium]
MTKPAKLRAIRVMVVDDHPVLRSGLARLLGLERDIAVVAEASSGKQAVAEWSTCRPDVALVDLLMPVMDGAETITRIRRVDPAARALVLSSSESAIDAARAERAGACGYLTKESDAREIAAAIREVHAGRTGVRRGCLRGPASAADGGLTARETEVLSLLRQGASNAQIGRALAISELTVKSHIRSMMEKLQASDRTGVVGRAFDLGLLKAGDR